MSIYILATLSNCLRQDTFQWQVSTVILEINLIHCSCSIVHYAQYIAPLPPKLELNTDC